MDALFKGTPLKHGLIFLAVVAASGPATAEIYRCQVDGETVFSQTPCAPDAEKLDIGYKSVPESDFDVQLRAAAAAGKVAIGMTSSMVRTAWGAPTDINRSVRSSGVSEQWVYRRGPGSAQYIYFDDGKVSNMSD